MATLEQIEKLVELGYLKAVPKRYRIVLRKEGFKESEHKERRMMIGVEWEEYKKKWIEEQHQRILKM